MAAKVSMTWKGDRDLQINLKSMDSRIAHVITGEFERLKYDAVTYMKLNAPWKDHTGNARSGLFGLTNYGPNYFELLLAHSVFYGIFLETRFNGKYAIINPTVKVMGELLMQRMNHAMERMGQ